MAGGRRRSTDDIGRRIAHQNQNFIDRHCVHIVQHAKIARLLVQHRLLILCTLDSPHPPKRCRSSSTCKHYCSCCFMVHAFSITSQTCSHSSTGCTRVRIHLTTILPAKMFQKPCNTCPHFTSPCSTLDLRRHSRSMVGT